MITVGIYGIKDVDSHSGMPIFTHDHGIAVMKNGKVLSFVQLERVTGVKHDNRLHEYLRQILRPYLESREEIRFVSVNSFVGNTFTSADGVLRIEPDEKVKVEDIIAPARCRLYQNGKLVKPTAYIMCHEFAHIASALPFTGYFKPGSLLVHIDGGAYDSASSVWYYDGKGIKCLSYSWKDLKYAANNFNVNPLARYILGLRQEDHLSMPGKLMGYSAYGKTDPQLRKWLSANGWFLDYMGSKEELLDILNRANGMHIKAYDTKEPPLMDIAATIQSDFLKKVIEYISKYQEMTGARYLYYSGGAALNIVTNSIIEKSGIFHEVYIPPAVSDCGLALGAAAYLEYLDHGKIVQCTPFLNDFGLPDSQDRHNGDINDVAEQLYRGSVAGICIGKGEAGPRALGHRSIIARTDDKKIRIRISEDMKKREWYRPVAPIVPDFIACDAFDVDLCKSNLSQYMLGNYMVSGDYKKEFSGVIHADGSVRAQVIKKADHENSYLYELLSSMYESYGICGLINTSFNMKGKPIVHFKEDAIRQGSEMGLDLVITDEATIKL